MEASLRARPHASVITAIVNSRLASEFPQHPLPPSAVQCPLPPLYWFGEMPGTIGPLICNTPTRFTLSRYVSVAVAVEPVARSPWWLNTPTSQSPYRYAKRSAVAPAAIGRFPAAQSVGIGS